MADLDGPVGFWKYWKSKTSYDILALHYDDRTDNVERIWLPTRKTLTVQRLASMEVTEALKTITILAMMVILGLVPLHLWTLKVIMGIHRSQWKHLGFFWKGGIQSDSYSTFTFSKAHCHSLGFRCSGRRLILYLSDRELTSHKPRAAISNS